MNDELELPRHTRGKRPHFFDDPAVDQLMSVVLAMAAEVSVLYDRVDAMQRVMDDKGSLTREELEAYQPDEAAAADREAHREAYLQRIFRVVRREAGVFSTKEAEAYTAEVEAELTPGN
jgi:hypothetical protein